MIVPGRVAPPGRRCLDPELERPAKAAGLVLLRSGWRTIRPTKSEGHSMKKAKRMTNSAATIQVAACTSRARPVASLIAA